MEIICGQLLKSLPLSLSLPLSRYLYDFAQYFKRRAYTRSKTQLPTTDDIDCRSEKHFHNKQLIFRTDQQKESNSSIESMIPIAFIVRPTTFTSEKNFISLLFVNICDLSCFGICFVGKFSLMLLPFILIWVFFRGCLAVDIRWWFHSSCSLCFSEIFAYKLMRITLK